MDVFFENRTDSFYAEHTSGLTFPLHLHPHLELFLIESESTEVTVCGEIRSLAPGSLAVIFPNQPHSYKAFSSSSRALLVICDLSCTGSCTDTLLRYHPKNPFLLPEEVHPNILFAARELAAEQQAGSSAAVYTALIQLILARIMPGLELCPNRNADEKELACRIVQYIQLHFREELTLDRLARELGVSRFYLSHIFSSAIGQSFPAYLSSIRLVCACSLLSQTSLPVTEIAEDSGFESQRTFFRVFRERYRLTPAEYRRRFKGSPLENPAGALPRTPQGLLP